MLTIMKDRGSTNQWSISKIKEAPISASPSHKDFYSHTLKNGIKLLLEKVNETFVTDFWKMYKLIIRYKVNSRDLSKKCFGTTLCVSNGVRFGVNI